MDSQTSQPHMGADKDKALIPSWVKEVMAKGPGEKRQQPWKDTFGDNVDKQLGGRARGCVDRERRLQRPGVVGNGTDPRCMIAWAESGRDVRLPRQPHQEKARCSRVRKLLCLNAESLHSNLLQLQGS